MGRVTSFIAALVVGVGLSSTAHSAEVDLHQPSVSELKVVDSAGNLRGAADITGGGKVEFELKDGAGNPAEGQTVYLKNTVTGEVLQAKSVGGVATFESVNPGIWVVSSDGVTFTNVTISSLSAVAAGGGVAASSGLTLLGAGGAIAGGTVGIISLSDGDNGEDDSSPDLSPFD